MRKESVNYLKDKRITKINSHFKLLKWSNITSVIIIITIIMVLIVNTLAIFTYYYNEGIK